MRKDDGDNGKHVDVVWLLSCGRVVYMCSARSVRKEVTRPSHFLTGGSSWLMAHGWLDGASILPDHIHTDRIGVAVAS